MHEQITNKIKGVKIKFKGFYKYKYINLTTSTIKRVKKHYIIKNRHIESYIY